MLIQDLQRRWKQINSEFKRSNFIRSLLLSALLNIRRPESSPSPVDAAMPWSTAAWNRQQQTLIKTGWGRKGSDVKAPVTEAGPVQCFSKEDQVIDAPWALWGLIGCLPRHYSCKTQAWVEQKMQVQAVDYTGTLECSLGLHWAVPAGLQKVFHCVCVYLCIGIDGKLPLGSYFSQLSAPRKANLLLSVADIHCISFSCLVCWDAASWASWLPLMTGRGRRTHSRTTLLHLSSRLSGQFLSTLILHILGYYSSISVLHFTKDM